MKLANKTIVITGATGGLGKLIAQKLDQENTNLILVDKDEVKLKTLIEALTGQNHSYFPCDFSNTSEILKLTQILKSQTESQIDILIHNAGIGIYENLEQLELVDWQKSFTINVTAPFLLTKELLPLLKKADNALVLSMGSVSGVTPMPNRSAYCTTKFALRGWSLSLAEEYKDTNINFCHVTLGSTLTEFGPLTIEQKRELQSQGKKYFMPEQVTQKIVELLKRDQREAEVVLDPNA